MSSNLFGGRKVFLLWNDIKCEFINENQDDRGLVILLHFLHEKFCPSSPTPDLGFPREATNQLFPISTALA
jgi:hypothetical protein